MEFRVVEAVVAETVVIGRRATAAELALIDGAVGIVVPPRGRLLPALTLTIKDNLITEYDVIADPTRLAQLSIALLDYQVAS